MRKQTIVIALLLLIAVFGLPVAANYDFDGFPLTTNSTGTITGDVYVSVGDRENETFTSSTVNHTSNYTLPNNISVKWASVYLDVWGCNKNNTGWINVSFNQGPWEKRFYNAQSDINSNTWGSGHGVIWARFDQTSNVTSGINRVDAKSTIGGKRIIRAVLVCAYNTSIPPGTSGDRSLVDYWVNDGNYNLHYEHVAPGYATNSTTTWFNGTVGKVCDAKLTTVHRASGGGYYGNESEPDYLYFDVIPTLLNHSPYYHRPNQLGDDGNETYGDDDYADGTKYSLNTSDVTCLVNATGDNSATFWRGHDDDGDGQIFHDSDWQNSTGAEGEAYLHPMLAVLVAENYTQKQRYARVNVAGGNKANYFSLPLRTTQSISSALGTNLCGGNYVVSRWNSTTGSWDSNYYSMMPGLSTFFDLDPGVGYQITADNDCTIVWTSED